MAASITWTDDNQRLPQSCITGVSGRFKFIPHGHDPQQSTATSSSTSKRVDHRTKNKAIQEVFLTVGMKSTMKLVFAEPPTGYPRLLNDPKDLVEAMVVYTRGMSTFAVKYEQAVSYGAQCILVINDNDDHPFTVISVAGQVHETTPTVTNIASAVTHQLGQYLHHSFSQLHFNQLNTSISSVFGGQHNSGSGSGITPVLSVQHTGTGMASPSYLFRPSLAVNSNTSSNPITSSQTSQSNMTAPTHAFRPPLVRSVNTFCGLFCVMLCRWLTNPV